MKTFLTYVLLQKGEYTYIDKIVYNQYRFEGEGFTMSKEALKELIKNSDFVYLCGEKMKYIK